MGESFLRSARAIEGGRSISSSSKFASCLRRKTNAKEMSCSAPHANSKIFLGVCVPATPWVYLSPIPPPCARMAFMLHFPSKPSFLHMHGRRQVRGVGRAQSILFLWTCDAGERCKVVHLQQHNAFAAGALVHLRGLPKVTHTSYYLSPSPLSFSMGILFLTSVMLCTFLLAVHGSIMRPTVCSVLEQLSAICCSLRRLLFTWFAVGAPERLRGRLACLPCLKSSSALDCRAVFGAF